MLDHGRNVTVACHDTVIVRRVVSATPAGRPRFLLTFLAWASGLSGGDRHLLEMGARWREHVDIEVLAPPQASPRSAPSWATSQCTRSAHGRG